MHEPDRTRPLSHVASWLAFVALVIAPLFAAIALVRHGVPEPIAVAAISAGAGLLVLLLQRLWTFNESWRSWHQTVGVDLLHGLFSTLGGGTLSKALLAGLAVWIAAPVATWFGGTVWPASLPLAAQVALALLLGEALAYGVHRFCHETRLGWRIHALHHSSEKLTLIAAMRNHPFNALFAHAALLLPAVVMGASAEVLMLTTGFTSLLGSVQHANINLRLGFLNYIVAGPEVHRIHHSTYIEDQKSNYGTNLMVLDLVFGTFEGPATRERHFEVGIPEYFIPKNFLVHLLIPFRLYRYFSQAVWDRMESMAEGARHFGAQMIAPSTSVSPAGAEPSGNARPVGLGD